MLRRFYLKHGYADFRVVSAVAELSPDKKSFVLTYVLDEGPRYQVADIRIVSEIKDVNTEELKEVLLLEAGDTYNAEKRKNRFMKLPKSLVRKVLLLSTLIPSWKEMSRTAPWYLLSGLRKGRAFLLTRLTSAAIPALMTTLSAASSELTRAMPLMPRKSELPAVMWRIWTISARLIFRLCRAMTATRLTLMSRFRKIHRLL